MKRNFTRSGALILIPLYLLPILALECNVLQVYSRLCGVFHESALNLCFSL